MVQSDEALHLLRDKLQSAAAQLDELNCSLAAAHVASALDAIELEIWSPVDGPTRTMAKLYAVALQQEVGDRAQSIVRQQLTLAKAGAFRSWSEILAQLKKLR